MKYVNTEEQLYTNTSEDKLMTLNDVVVQAQTAHVHDYPWNIHTISMSLYLYVCLYVLYEG